MIHLNPARMGLRNHLATPVRNITVLIHSDHVNKNSYGAAA